MYESFQPKGVNSSPSVFQPCQIVCLEHGDVRLYAEVVQMASGKHVCWVRPLAMVEHPSIAAEAFYPTEELTIFDLRQSSDLLLPAVVFRSAIDTEVIPILSQFSDRFEPQNNQLERSQTQLRELIRKVCLAHPELF